MVGRIVQQSRKIKSMVKIPKGSPATKLPWLVILLFPALILSSCGNNSYTPKPRAYPRIIYPEKAYQTFDSSCPFQFRYPEYARVLPDTTADSARCWLNVRYLPFDAKLYLTYQRFSKPAELYKLVEDSRNFVYKHTIKAQAIKENLIRADTGVAGIFYELAGNAATAIQFYVTDSTRHFMRGSLYFNTKPNRDSLDPVIRFLRKDILRLINTLEWKYSRSKPGKLEFFKKKDQ